MLLLHCAPRRPSRPAAIGVRHRRETPHPADPLQCADREKGRPAHPARHRHRDPDPQQRPRRLGADDVAITVGARKLQDILRALPDTADVSLTLDDKRITLKAGKSRFQLQTLPAADYPRLAPPEGEAVHFTTTQKAFKKQLALVQYAMAQQDIRYYLNGLLLVVAGERAAHGRHRRPPPGLRRVPAGGRLRAHRSDPAAQDRARTGPPARRQRRPARDHCWSATRSCSASAHRADLQAHRWQVPRLRARHPAGPPQAHQDSSRQPLLQSLQRAAILTNEKFRGVRLVLSEGSLKLISTNAEQEEAQEELEVDYTGEPRHRLQRHLSARRAEQRLPTRSNPPQRRQLQRPVHPAGNERFKYVVMPMRI
jgi:DNA polymerase-3 subunit beta